MSIPFYLDLETIPDQDPDAMRLCFDEVNPPGNIKKPESVEKWMLEKGPAVAMENYHKTGLHGISGEICSIAWALDDGEVHSIMRGQDTRAEHTLLCSFFAAVLLEADDMTDGFPRLRWIAHNSEFDLRFLYQRCVINNVNPEFPIPVDARPGGDSVYCTMKAWAGMYGQKFVSQAALANALGIEVQDDIDGSMVWDMYQEGAYDVIEAYNRSDVRTVREIYKRLNFL